MRRPDNKTLITAGIMFVVILLLTWLLRIELNILRDGVSAGAFIHPGDIGVYIAAGILGGPWAALASALGSGLADVFAGSAIYAIPSLIIKAAMAFLLAHYMKKDHTWLGLIRGLILTGVLMVLGYFIFDLVIMGDYEVAALSLPFNLLQMIVCGLVALPVLKIFGGKNYQQQAEPVITTRRVK